MTPLSLIADCICSGQVPDWQVPGLVLETPGLAAELNRRSRATSPVLTGEAGRGASISSPDDLRPADPCADILFEDDRSITVVGPCEPRIHAAYWFDTSTQTLRDGHFPFAPVVFDPLNLPRQGALAHRLPEEKGGGLLKTRRLVFQFIRSLHPPSFLRKLMRK